MADKVSDLSIDRVFWILRRGQPSVCPEKIIIYGLFFIGVVILVNWFLSVTVLLVKPFLYAAITLAVVRPETIYCLTTDDRLVHIFETLRGFLTKSAVGLLEFLHFLIQELTRKIN